MPQAYRMSSDTQAGLEDWASFADHSATSAIAFEGYQRRPASKEMDP
ncbi:hypothetical protein [Azorhizobium doebereinerae]|nr:hypothetical protein [Azorhizobium doebereinerae]